MPLRSTCARPMTTKPTLTVPRCGINFQLEGVTLLFPHIPDGPSGACHHRVPHVRASLLPGWIKLQCFSDGAALPFFACMRRSKKTPCMNTSCVFGGITMNTHLSPPHRGPAHSTFDPSIKPFSPAIQSVKPLSAIVNHPRHRGFLRRRQ